MRILLVSPNTLTVPYPVYPLGLDYVAGSIASKHQVRIADLNVVTDEEFDEILNEHEPEIIGISCRNIDNTEAGDPLFFIREYSKFVERLKRKTDALIVCGGAGFTILPEAIFQALDADYGIIGEGERFGLLVDALDADQDVDNIPGLLIRGTSAVKPAPWEGTTTRVVNSRADHFEFYLQKGGMLNLQTKRGCSFNCIYCPYPYIEGRKHRFFTPAEVADTALALQAGGAKYIFITDSAFNSDVNHSLEVAAALKQAEVTIPWGGFFAPVKMPPDYFIRMAAAGLSHVEFGTESMSGQMLKTYRKPFRARDVFSAHEQAVDAGLHVAHYFLLGGPGESVETVNESLQKIEQLPKAAFFFFIGIRIYPHTAIHDIALKEGKISGSTDLLQPVFYYPDRIDPVAIEQLVREQARDRVNWIIGSGGADAASTVERMYGKGYTGPLWEYLIR